MSALVVFGGFQLGLSSLKVLKRGAHMRLVFSDEAGRDKRPQQCEHKNPRTLGECFHSFAPV